MYLREDLQDLAKKLHSLNCEKSDDVIDLMSEIACALKDYYGQAYLHSKWFDEGNWKYVHREAISFGIDMTICSGSVRDSFTYMTDLLLTLKSNKDNWYCYNDIEEAYYNVDINKLREDKAEFLSKLKSILERW